MKKIISNLLFTSALMIVFASCADMNDKLDVYLAEGERIYIGKIDSIHTFAGENRIKLAFWASDPRAQKAGFYWYPNNDSMIVDIAPKVDNTYFEAFIGGPNSTKSIEEGNYTLKIITRDGAKHYSVPFEKIINIYGDKFRASLTNRVLKTIAYQATTSALSLTFSGPTNEKEIGVGIQYTNKLGVAQSLILPNSVITSAAVVVPNVDKTLPVSYRTMFLPEPLAIDTFYTTSKVIIIP